MPQKSYLFFFVGVTVVSVAIHVFVYRQLSRTIRKDFGSRGEKFLRFVRIVFFVMDSPFLVLALRKQIPFDPFTYVPAMFYPFTVWLALLFFWAALLLPFSLYRGIMRLVRRPSMQSPRRGDIQAAPHSYEWSVEQLQPESLRREEVISVEQTI